MRIAPPESLNSDVRPVLTAHVSQFDLMRLFPVQFAEVDALAAAEPCKAALLRLDSGRLVVIEYGTVTSTVTVSVPLDADSNDTLIDLLVEAPLGSSIEWLSDEVLPEDLLKSSSPLKKRELETEEWRRPTIASIDGTQLALSLLRRKG